MGGGQLGRVDGDHVGGCAQAVEGGEGDAQAGGLGLVHVRVVEEDRQVEGAQEFDDAAADAGGADDAHGAAVVAGAVQFAEPVVGGAQRAIAVRGVQDALVGEEDRGERVFGDGLRVGGGRRGDGDAAAPTGVRDMGFDRPAGVDDGAQAGGPVEDGGGQRGRSPRGQEDFGVGQRGGHGRGRVGQVVGHQGGIGTGERCQTAAVVVGEEAVCEAGLHGEQQGGAGKCLVRGIVSGVVHGGSVLLVRGVI